MSCHVFVFLLVVHFERTETVALVLAVNAPAPVKLVRLIFLLAGSKRRIAAIAGLARVVVHSCDK